MPSVAIIGAGIAGLSCGRALAAAGVEVTIFEKSRSLGGRCATRKWEGHIVDHGAQYFTMRDAAFRAEVEALCGDHLRGITAPFVDARGDEIPARLPRWYHAQGNNRLGRALLGDLPVRMECPIASVESRDGRWIAGGESFEAVVSAAPWPQTLALLGREGGSGLYAPCLTAFFAYRGAWVGNSASAYARLDAEGELAWSACENHKAGRIGPDRTVFVAQASPAFSLAWLEAEPGAWAPRLRDALEARWEALAADRLATFTHRWRFARRVLAPPALDALPPGFFVTGDGQTESRLEAVWLAGRDSAKDVLTSIQRQ